VQVPEATLERIDDLSRVRVALEGLATELAAASMSAETLYKIDHLANQMMISAGSGKWQNYLAQNQEYHFLIYAASGSSILMRLIEGLWLQTGPLMTYFRMERAEQTQDEDALGLHHAVAEALRGGDAAQARRLVEDDVREGMDYLREVLRQSSS
jgi:DNA-binding GntR family transcriptional regulator